MMNDFEIKLLKRQLSEHNILNILNYKSEEFQNSIVGLVFYKYKDVLSIVGAIFNGATFEDKKEVIMEMISHSNEFIKSVFYDERVSEYVSRNTKRENLYSIIQGMLEELRELNYISLEENYEIKLDKKIETLLDEKGLPMIKVYERVMLNYGVNLKELESYAIGENNNKGRRGL